MEKKMQKLKHLLWRMGFGPRTQSWDKWIALPENAWWPKMKDDSAIEPEYFDIADSAIKGLLMGIGEIGRMERRELDQAEKKTNPRAKPRRPTQPQPAVAGRNDAYTGTTT